MEIYIVKCCAEINCCKIDKLTNFVMKELRCKQIERREGRLSHWDNHSGSATSSGLGCSTACVQALISMEEKGHADTIIKKKNSCNMWMLAF